MKVLIPLLLFSQMAFANYTRSSFKHWVDEDRDCLNTRQEVLQKDSIKPVEIKNCRVINGKWYDVYSGKYYTNPTELDIDHIVPLKEAYKSGADKWTPKQREAFANDYENLIAVHRTLNRQKGAKDPAQWLPPHKGYICEYITRWVYVKGKYKLNLDATECKAINNSKCIKKRVC